MSSGLYSIGVSGMNVAQLGLVTTEHNIANATTVGYNRQRTIQVTNIPMMTGAGALGQGARVSTVERMYNQFISGQVNRAQAGVSELDAYYAEISQIDNMLAGSSSGLSPALQDFFMAAQQVAANPASMSARQSMVSTAESLVNRYQGLHDRLSELADGVNGQIQSIVGYINSYSQQIAELNNRIVIAESSVQQPANDLRDQRDQLVGELNKLVRVQVNEEGNGSYNIYIGSGQQLVVGTQVQEMTATPAISDMSTFVVGLKSASGMIQELPDRLVNGGQLGGLLRFRTEALSPAFNQLGQVAATMALTFNAQHALGQDLLGQSLGEGNFQSNFFTLPQPTVLTNANNSGTATVQASFLVPPPINGHYTLANNAGTYTLTRLSDGVEWSGATPAALQAALPAGEGIDVTAATVALGSTVRLVNATAQTANFYTNISASDYRLTYDAAGYYTLIRVNDNQQWTTDPAALPPARIAADLAGLQDMVSASEGFSFTVGAGIAAGDSFLIQPTKQMADGIALNVNIANDPRLLAAAMPARASLGMANTGSGQISNMRTVAGYSSTTAVLPFTLTSGVSAATARVSTTAGAFVAGDYTLSGALAQFDLTDDTGTTTVDLSGTVWSGDEAGLAAEITNQLALAGSNTVASYAAGRLVFTSGETGSAAVQPTVSNVGADLVASGLVAATMVNSGGADAQAILTISPAGQNVAVTVGGATTVYSGATIPYDMTRGATFTVNGISFDLFGAPNNGDVFRFERNAGGNADGRNVLALGKLQIQKTVAGGTANYQDAYARLVSDNGNRTRQIEVTGKAQQALLEHAVNTREAMSGVNLDEEAANLIRYQQAYQASAKMLEIGSKLFETLLALG